MAFITGMILTLTAPAYAAPQRIVSAHLCADQWVLQLVEPSRIAAVSTLAHDPAVSRLAGVARHFPAVRSEAEAIMRYKPDLVLLGSFGQQVLENRLKRLGVPTLRIAEPATWDEVASQTQTLGVALDAAVKAREVMEEAQHTLSIYPACEECPFAAIVWEGGYASPPTGLHAELARRAGFALSPSLKGQIDTERLLHTRPSHVFIARHYEDAGRASEWFSHPVWQHLRHSRINAAALSCAEPGALTLLPQMKTMLQERE